MARYKWDSPQEWLRETREREIAEAEKDGTHSALQNMIANLMADLNNIVPMLDADDVQDIYQDEMDQAGYFRDLDKIYQLELEQCVRILENHSIEYRDDDTPIELWQAIESNVEDGTIDWSEIEEALNG